MPRYDFLFNRELDTGERLLREGETFEHCGELWRVEKVERDGAVRPRVHLVQTSDEAVPDGEEPPRNGDASAEPERRPVSLAAGLAEVEAHVKAQVATFEQPTSFEGELVYTLNDISTRLSTLARVLNTYWGKGAA
jgi:hypothetical protein